jgi:hypothetical protein
MITTRTSAIPAATAMLKRCTYLYALKGRRVLPDGPMLLPKDAASTQVAPPVLLPAARLRSWSTQV